MSGDDGSKTQSNGRFAGEEINTMLYSGSRCSIYGRVIKIDDLKRFKFLSKLKTILYKKKI